MLDFCKLKEYDLQINDNYILCSQSVDTTHIPNAWGLTFKTQQNWIVFNDNINETPHVVNHDKVLFNKLHVHK